MFYQIIGLIKHLQFAVLYKRHLPKLRHRKFVFENVFEFSIMPRICTELSLGDKVKVIQANNGK